jgi:cold shock protein
MADSRGRLRGIVASFNDDRGFGFVRGKDDREYFVRWTEIAGDGHRTLSVGEEVVFAPHLEQGSERLQALNVRRAS